MQNQTNRSHYKVICEVNWEGSLSQYELKTLKKMQVRRLPAIHRVAIDLCLSEIDFSKVAYLVHSSRHGELTTSTELTKQLLDGDSLSPIKFSQSTHNALSGNLSIFSKNKYPVNSLSAGEKSYEMGLISAEIAVKEIPKDKWVVYLYTESEISGPLSEQLNIVNQVKIRVLQNEVF